jgi:hypothetical protein
MSDMYDVDHLSVHPGDDAPPSAGEVYPEVVEEDRSGDGFTDFVSVTTPNGEIHVIKDVDGDGDAGERTPSPTDGGDVWTRADLDSDPRFIGLVDVLDQAFDV